jgi:hypothetical protein
MPSEITNEPCTWRRAVAKGGTTMSNTGELINAVTRIRGVT